MQIHALIEPVPHNGYRAKSGEPLPVIALGATPEDAVRNLRDEIGRQLTAGKQFMTVEIGADNPWLAMAGMHDPNDPLIQQWKEEMAAYRQEVENDPSRP